MKIKRTIRWITLFSVGLTFVGVVGLASWKINNDAKRVNAFSNIERFYCHGETEDECVGVEYQDSSSFVDDTTEIEASVWQGGESIFEHDATLPSKYDARLKYPGVRTKDQHTEGLCWMYSGTTALEYNIAKNFEDYEVSIKHLDYLTIDGRYVYKQPGDTNVYFDKYLSVDGAAHRTDLGTSGNNHEFMYGIMNPLAIMSEKDFTNVMVANDDRLMGINRYEDLWDDNIISGQKRNEILKVNFERSLAYMEKQNYGDVNDSSKVKYMVTGAKMLSYGFDAERTAESGVVDTIKNIVDEYGAVKVSTFGTADRFNKCSDKKTVDGGEAYTFIVDNRTIEDGGAMVECTANHGMTIVGWDDEWTYTYNNEERHGAFVLQNSWGESERDSSKWHLAYISALPSLMFFDSVESFKNYDYYYGPAEYDEPMIEPAADELIFELSSNSVERLEAFTFGALYNTDEYDVFVSTTGNVDDFKRDGTFVSQPGIEKYTFNDVYDVDGRYAIKLKKTGGGNVSDGSRKRDLVTAMTGKVWSLSIGNISQPYKINCRVIEGLCDVDIPPVIPIRDNYDFIGYTDAIDAEEVKYQPGDNVILASNKSIYAVWSRQSDDSGDSGDVDDDLPVPSTAGKPDTGENTNGGDGTNFTVIPVATVIIAGLLYLVKRKSGHIRFER